jgi:hypothetical protein
LSAKLSHWRRVSGRFGAGWIECRRSRISFFDYHREPFDAKLGPIEQVRTHRTLLVSLTLNAALLTAWFALREPLVVAPVAPQPAAAAAVTNMATPTDPVVTASEPPVLAPQPFHWRCLDSPDGREYVANLRRVNCPEHVIRDLLVAKLGAMDRSRARAQPVFYEPWVGSDRREADRLAERVRQNGRREEQAKLIRELLGYDWNDEVSREWSREEMAGVFLGFLSDEKAQQVMAHVMRAVQGIEDKLEGFRSRIVLDEDLAEMKRFRTDLAQQLARFLSPAELDELETRTQIGLLFTDQIHLEGMEPTGAELRAILAASRSHRDFFSSILMDFGRSREERGNWPGRAEFEAELVRALGAARFADYQRAQDESFREAFEFTKQQDLPRTVAMTLYDAQRTAQVQWREINEDAGLTATERQTAQEVLQAATMAAVANTLGKQFTNYLNGNGRWLRELTTAPKPKPTTRGGRR